MEEYVLNIENTTLNNKYYRRVLFTSTYQQLVVMNLNPNQEIGWEIHDIDQFIRVESGMGYLYIQKGDKINQYTLKDGIAAIIPKGVNHNIYSIEGLKLYTIYSLPEHEDGLIEEAKPE